MQVCRPGLLLNLARDLDARNAPEYNPPTPTAIALHLGSGEPDCEDVIAKFARGVGIVEATEHDVDGLTFDRGAHALLGAWKPRGTAGQGDERIPDEGNENDRRGGCNPRAHAVPFTLVPSFAADHAADRRIGLAATQSNAAAPM